MGSKVLRNISKVLRSAANRIFGAGADGIPRELEPADVRSIIGVYSTSEVDAIIGGIDGLTSADIDTLAEINAILSDADLASVSYVDGLASNYATAAQGLLADSAVQPGDLATVATTGSYNDLSDKPAGASGDVVGPASAVDNAAARFDTTTGKLIQDASWIIHDNLTASPNNTVNHACLEATGGTTNVSVSIKPKGTGAFMLAVPDGTSAGGNARGVNAVDLQRQRSASTQVAGGENSFLGPGQNGTASGDRSTSLSGGTASANDTLAWRGTASGVGAAALAHSTVASGSYSAAFAFAAQATGSFTVSVGVGCTAAGEGSFACGRESNSRIYGSFAFASLGDVSGRGNKQMMMLLLRNSTSGTTPAELFADGSSQRLTVPSGKVLQAMIFVSGSKNDGSAVATYSRMYAVKNVGGTTSEVFAPQTLGTDTAAGTSIAITANNTNDALQISVTGITGETWRWQAFVMWSEFIWSA